MKPKIKGFSRFLSPKSSAYDFKLNSMFSENLRITLELVACSEPEDADADGRYLFIT